MLGQKALFAPDDTGVSSDGIVNEMYGKRLPRVGSQHIGSEKVVSNLVLCVKSRTLRKQCRAVRPKFGKLGASDRNSGASIAFAGLAGFSEECFKGRKLLAKKKLLHKNILRDI
jgi:hypothetical protein